MINIFTQIKNKHKNRGKINTQKAQKAFAMFALFLLPFLITPGQIGASKEDERNEIIEQKEEAKEELSAINGRKKTLEGQVASFNSQIGTVESQIYTAQTEILKINREIANTNTKIKQAQLELETAKDQLSEFIRVMYEEGQISTIEIMAKSGSFNEFVNRSEYMEQVQHSVKKSADVVVALKNELDAKKIQLEGNKKKSEELKLQLAAQRNELVTQKSAKDDLLRITKGDQAKYSALIKDLQNQQNKLEKELWSGGGTYVSLGRVNKGDIIGYQGNTGYSSGPHLHFEIRTPGQVATNPANYVGNGFWGHPLPGARVTCAYGCYYKHYGIDYAKYYGAPIIASADGEIIARVTGKGNTYNLYNSCLINTKYNYSYCSKYFNYGNYVKIEHDNGWYSLYAHLR